MGSDKSEELRRLSRLAQARRAQGRAGAAIPARLERRADTLPFRPAVDASNPPPDADSRTRPIAAVRDSGPDRALHGMLLDVLTPTGAGARPAPLTEDAFARLSISRFDARANALIRVCRGGPAGAARAVQNVVALFWMLGQTLSGETADSIKRLFFRFIPTLIQVAYRDFSDNPVCRADGVQALDKLQQMLVEISSTQLTPSESARALSSIDQMAVFIATGDYPVANSVVGSQLARFMERSRLRRALYHLMQAEAEIDRYIRERLGRGRANIQLPQDVPLLSDYAPLRIFQEPRGGQPRQLMELQLPNIERPDDVVVRMVGAENRVPIDQRLDALGALELLVPDDSYELGLVYDPPRAC